MTLPRRAPGGFPVVGVIGGGQLARMLQAPAVALGVQLSVLGSRDEIRGTPGWIPSSTTHSLPCK